MKEKNELLKEFYNKKINYDGFVGKDFSELTDEEKTGMSETYSFKMFEVGQTWNKLKHNFTIQDELNDLWNAGFKTGIISGVIAGVFMSAVVYVVVNYLNTLN